MVEITPNLTLDASPVNALVAVEVDNPNNRPILTKTFAEAALSNETVEILSIIPCDENGYPQNAFTRDSHVHANITLRNNDAYSHTITINAYAQDTDYTLVSPEVATLEITILPQAIIQFKPDLYIEKWVSPGPATFFASVYSALPRDGGVPYSSEKSATFNITTDEWLASTARKADSSAMGFRLRPDAIEGSYTIQANARYNEETASTTATFEKEHQLLGDVNFDHFIDILDIVTMTSVYGATSNDPFWKPWLDIRPDGKIDISDIVIAAGRYGTRYQVEGKTLANTSRKSAFPDLASEKTATREAEDKERDRTLASANNIETGIDIYTQYPEGYNARGVGTPSDMFWPQKEVRLYAYVAFNGWPEQNRDVAFQVNDPHGTIMGIFYNRTGENGIALVKFHLPFYDPDYNFGEWTITGTASIAGEVYNDVLYFKYDYHARLWQDRITTDKSSYEHDEMINVTVEYGTQSMQTFNAFFTVTAIDETGVPFASEWVANLIGGALYGTYANGTLALNLYVPKFVRAGIAELHISILQDLTGEERLCPAFTMTVQIEAN